MSPIALAVAILILVASASATLLMRDVSAARLRERVGVIRSRPEEQEESAPVRPISVRSSDPRTERMKQLMRFLRFNPDVRQQNVIACKLVFLIAVIVAVVGLFYSQGFFGWPIAALLAPIDGILVARLIFGWEQARFQRALLEQIPEVMAMICRTVGAGLPFSEALRSVAREGQEPSREEFNRVINEVAIGQSVERALWKLHERVGLPEYAFFAVTIGLQTQTGGSLIETLQNLQELVRKRVALSKRGKALAAEARASAVILAVLPFIAFFALSFIQDDFVHFFLSTPTGNHLLLAAIGFLCMGILTMRQLIRRSLRP
jgi:tight adherence protein B